jgi:hypothetical protein
MGDEERLDIWSYRESLDLLINEGGSLGDRHKN